MAIAAMLAPATATPSPILAPSLNPPPPVSPLVEGELEAAPVEVFDILFATTELGRRLVVAVGDMDPTVGSVSSRGRESTENW